MNRRCSARSSRTGERCRRPPIQGGTVCPSHGGSAPQVRAKAGERLFALAEPAVIELTRLLKRAQPDSTRLQAVTAILDRTGHPRQSAIQLDVGGLVARISELTPEQAAELAQALEEE